MDSRSGRRITACRRPSPRSPQPDRDLEPFKGCAERRPLLTTWCRTRKQRLFCGFRRSISTGSTPRPARSALRHPPPSPALHPQPDGCTGPALVQRISRRQDRHVRYQTEKFTEWSCDAMDQSPTSPRQERGRLDRVHAQRPRGGSTRRRFHGACCRTTSINRVFVDSSARRRLGWRRWRLDHQLEPLDRAHRSWPHTATATILLRSDRWA